MIKNVQKGPWVLKYVPDRFIANEICICTFDMYRRDVQWDSEKEGMEKTVQNFLKLSRLNDFIMDCLWYSVTNTI